MIDGLEMQLLVLRDLEEVARFTDTEEPKACANCFQLEELCVCPVSGLFWPVGIVATRIESRLRRR